MTNRFVKAVFQLICAAILVLSLSLSAKAANLLVSPPVGGRVIVAIQKWDTLSLELVGLPPPASGVQRAPVPVADLVSRKEFFQAQGTHLISSVTVPSVPGAKILSLESVVSPMGAEGYWRLIMEAKTPDGLAEYSYEIETGPSAAGPMQVSARLVSEKVIGSHPYTLTAQTEPDKGEIVLHLGLRDGRPQALVSQSFPLPEGAEIAEIKEKLAGGDRIVWMVRLVQADRANPRSDRPDLPPRVSGEWIYLITANLPVFYSRRLSVILASARFENSGVFVSIANPKLLENLRGIDIPEKPPGVQSLVVHISVPGPGPKGASAERNFKFRPSAPPGLVAAKVNPKGVLTLIGDRGEETLISPAQLSNPPAEKGPEVDEKPYPLTPEKRAVCAHLWDTI